MKRFWMGGISLMLLLGAFAYMAADNQPPYGWETGEVIPDPAPDGATVSIHWRFKVHRVCPGIVQRQIIDAQDVVHNYDPVPAASVRDVTPDFWVTFTLPTGLPPGPSKYRVHAEYYCNPLQYIWPIHVTTPEIIFTLENKKPAKS